MDTGFLMHQVGASRLLGLLVSLLVLGVLFDARVYAQEEPTGALTQEQLDVLQNLPPEQRDALIEEYLRQRQPGATTTGAIPGTTQTIPGTAGQRGTTGREVRALSPEERAKQEQRLLRMRLKELEEETTPRLRPGDTLIIDLTLRNTTTATDRLNELRNRIVVRNPYRLDPAGQLLLPGFEPLMMAGVSEELASKRLGADKDFTEFIVKITRLQLAPVGDEALKPFGYDIFTDAESTFAPAVDIPVPSDYVVGPGDQLRVQLYGSTNRSVTLTVGRDGQVSLPQIGPIAVAGQRFSAVKSSIESRISQQMIGVRADLQMGATRAIQIFLLGEVERPGSYTVSGLSTVTNALFAGGGMTRVGSLRNIQLKRNGQLIRTLDLYDLLLKGDTSNDARLLAGDVVFIPPVGSTAAVNGEVLRPAIYEIRSSSTVGDLLRLSGGLTPQAEASEVRLERLNERGERAVTNLDLNSGDARALVLRNGDILRILRVRNTLDGAVSVAGHVYQPAPFEYHPGLRLSEVLSFESLKPRADTHYVLIRRELPPDRKVSVLSADLAAALAARGSDKDVLLAPRDQITVFDLDSGRDRIVSEMLTELRAQATFDRPLQAVIIGGRVRTPGQYPLEPNMHVSDLIRAGGSLEDAAYGGKAELSRYEAVNGEYRQTELIEIDLAAVLRGDPTADIALKPYDALNIKELPLWRELEIVRIEGEVRFPGVYPIQRGETLRTVLERAGGLNDQGFPDGSVFTREGLRQREQDQLDRLTARLKRDLAVLALQGAQGGGQGAQAYSVGQSLLGELEGSKAVGRMVINLPEVLTGQPGGPQDIVLKNGDRLIVPKKPQEVTVIGEVQNATSLRFAEGKARDDYIALSGGYTSQADKSKIYVVRANGSVVANSGNGWFSKSSEEIRPGDTIVVPLNAAKMRALPMWTAVTQILYQLAIAVAAVKAL